MGTRVVEHPPMGGDQTLVTIDDIRAAAERLEGVIRSTPVDRSETLSALAGRPVILKPEHRQRTGSFKIRGAYNRISRLPPGTPVVAGSAGNHAQGVALAAKLTGHPGTIGLELASEAPEATTVVVPIGGGGLISGIAAALAAVRPDVRVVGVEAAGAPTMVASLEAGHCVRLERLHTMADGIALKSPSPLT